MPLDSVYRSILIVLGIGFLAANVRVFAQAVRVRRLRPTALLIWPGRPPPFYPFLLGLGAILAALVAFKIGVQRRPPWDAFGETMMGLYYVYALPLSLRFGRGFYAEGIWTESGFVPYSQVGGLRWREGPPPTLVLIDRLRPLARTLAVPESCYGEARRVLRDKIGSHDITFVGKSLDLGSHDERDDV
jgi:hypothetical protein